MFDYPKAWFDMLPWAQFWYNTSFHHSIGMPSFKDVFGRDPPLFVPYECNSKDPASIQESLTTRDTLL